MSEFDRLPDEMLQEILLLCVDELDPDSMYPDDFLTICKRWLNLALSYPQLWSNISITISTNRSKQAQYQPPLHVVSRWIDRSSSCPLSFAIDRHSNTYSGYPGRSNMVDSHVFKRIMELYAPHHLRWKRVTIDLEMNGVWACPTGLSLLAHPSRTLEYPKLELITIRNLSWDLGEFHEDTDGLVHLLTHSPRLATVDFSVTRIPRHWDSTPDSFETPALRRIEAAMPCQQLTRLEYVAGSVTPERLTQWLESCPQLLYIRADIDPKYGLGDGDETNPIVVRHTPQRHARHTQVYHDRLEELHLNATSEDAAIFFNNLTLPSLRVFSFQAISLAREGHRQQESADAFTSLIQRSNSFIEKFNVETGLSGLVNDRLLIQYLRAISFSLQELDIDADFDGVVEALIVADPAKRPNTSQENPHSLNESILCPHLRTIKLRSWGYSGDSTIAQMVESRWNPVASGAPSVAQLQSVDVAIYGETDDPNESWSPYVPESLEGDKERLQVLAQDGSGKKIRLAMKLSRGDHVYVNTF